MRGTSDGGEAVGWRRGRGDGVSAQQWRAILQQRLVKPDKEAGIRLAFTERKAEQHAHRLGAFGRKVGHVGGNQLPRHIGRVLRSEKMHALGHHVVGQDQCFAAHLQQCAVIVQPARALVGGDAPQPGDEGQFIAQEVRSCIRATVLAKNR